MEFEPTEKDRATVKAMAAYGVPQEQIMAVIGVSKPTLHKYFRKELDTAMIEANAQVAQSLFNQAVKHGNVTAMIFWLKTRAKEQWKESPQQVEHTGKDGGPMQTVQLNTDDPQEAARAYQKLMGE